MPGRFLSPKDLAAAKKVEEAFNALRRRGEIRAPEEIVRLHHVVCGCGAEGCVFMHAERQEKEVADEKVTDKGGRR